MALERRLVERSLSAKGFVLEEKHHRFYKLHVAGKYTGIYTKVSTSKEHRTLGDPLVAAMAKQLHLSKRDFLDLVECSLTGPGYLEKLRAAGVDLT